ncbi:hypothetical protein LTR64_006098 [Lithohypha guttulata]|uniref:uncharacterized protein n=1 Tax=Lithohypha guttulata TaxID=1690604 RepID=UPI002DE1DE20|nr:hypothetical protein LTR51_002104 [Lithohypha guttulata]
MAFEKTRAAIYAQERRDNEIQAREELQTRLVPSPLTDIVEARGDFNLTTKILGVALLQIDPSAHLPQHVLPPEYSTRSREYNQLRRLNENDVRRAIKHKIPAHILQEDFMQQSNFNQTTKVIVAIAKYLDELKAIENTLMKEEQSPACDDSTHNGESAIKAGCIVLQVTMTFTNMAESSSKRSSETSFFQSSPDRVPIILHKRTRDEFESAQVTHFDRLLNLDLKPPPLKAFTEPISMPASTPGAVEVKNNDAQRPWLEQHDKAEWEDQRTDLHPISEIRLLEQAAKRLIAKAKEMLEPVPDDVEYDNETAQPRTIMRKGYLARRADLSPEQMEDLAWIHDLLVDACAVVEGTGESRKIVRKWERSRRDWGKFELLQDELSSKS